MDQIVEQVLATLRGMWRRRWYGVLAAWVVAVLGAVIVTRIPDRFEAEARVYVDTKSVLRPLMRDLAVEPDLGSDDRDARPHADHAPQHRNADQARPSCCRATHRKRIVTRMVDALLRSIKVTAVSRDNVFAFSYRDTDPERGRRVVQDLVSLFVESDLGSKQRDVEGARNFIEEQVAAVRSAPGRGRRSSEGIQAAQHGHAGGAGRGLLRAHRSACVKR